MVEAGTREPELSRVESLAESKRLLSAFEEALEDTDVFKLKKSLEAVDEPVSVSTGTHEYSAEYHKSFNDGGIVKRLNLSRHEINSPEDVESIYIMLHTDRFPLLRLYDYGLLMSHQIVNGQVTQSQSETRAVVEKIEIFLSDLQQNLKPQG